MWRGSLKHLAQIALHPAIPEIRNECNAGTFADIYGVAQRVDEGDIGSARGLYPKRHTALLGMDNTGSDGLCEYIKYFPPGLPGCATRRAIHRTAAHGSNNIECAVQHRARCIPGLGQRQCEGAADERGGSDGGCSESCNLGIAVGLNLGDQQPRVMDTELLPQGEVLIEGPAQRAERIDREARVDHADTCASAPRSVRTSPSNQRTSLKFSRLLCFSRYSVASSFIRTAPVQFGSDA